MKTHAIRQELDQARASGPLRQIQIPPCPELLQRLRAAMDQPQPDLNEVARIAAADVAMSATLLRVANSPLHLVAGHVPCTTVGQAMYRLGLDESAALMQASSLDEAEAALLHAYKIEGAKMAGAQMLLGMVYSQKQNAQKAIEAFETYLRDLPDAPNAAQVKEAIARLRKGVKKQ